MCSRRLIHVCVPYRAGGYQASTTNTSPNSTTNTTEWSLDDDDEDDLDISDICDEVLLSPEEPSIDWEEQLSPESPRITRDPPGTSTSRVTRSPHLDSRDRHSDARESLSGSRDNLSGSRDRLSGSRDSLSGSRDRLTSTHDGLSGSRDRLTGSRERLSDSRERHSESRSKRISSRHTTSFQGDNIENGERGSERLSAREVFWLRTSRPRWRRKVASADTSPEEPRRNRFGRGWSIDGRGSHSDTEDPDILYDRRHLLSKDAKIQSPTSHSTASPPSPHGMYTWPPQHNRHRHHSSSENEEYDNEEDSSHQQSSQRAGDHYDNMTLRRPSTSSRYDASPVHDAHHFDISPRRSKPSDSYDSHSHAKDKTSKHQEKLTHYTDSASHYYSSSADNTNHQQKYSSSSHSGEGQSRHVESGGRKRERSPPQLRDSRPRHLMHPHEADDPYIYHGLAPTLAPHLSAVYSPRSLPTHFSYDHPEDYLSSLAFTEPYSPDPYAEMLANAEMYPREPYPHYSYEGDASRVPLEHEARMMEQHPHPFFLLDTAELAPWSSPPAYPIGPLGASWLQHGLHPLARIPPCLIPTPYSRPRPHAPLASPPWRLTHHASLPSMSTLDPTTDEFLVDAGIRIDESVIKSRLPTPQHGASRISRWRTPDRSYSSHSAGNKDSNSMENKSRGSSGLSGSRLRQPSIVTTSRIPAPPGSVGHQNTLTRSHSEQESNQRDGRTPSGSRRGSQGTPSGSGVVTRLRPPSRPNRPVSTVATSSSRGPLSPRTKSLSHENLRTSPSRLALPTSPPVSPNTSRATSPHTSPQESEGRPRTLAVSGSRLRQPQVRAPRGRGSRPTSCSSSPGGSRCSSPGLDGPVSGFGRGSRSNSRTGSASSSPVSSRCSSPASEDLRSLTRGSQHRSSASSSRSGSGMSHAGRRSTSSTPDQQQVTTPPSPLPSPRTHRQGSSIPKPSSGLRGRPTGSKLPLPTSAKN